MTEYTGTFCVVCNKPLEVKKYYSKDGTFKGYGMSFKKITCSRSCTNVYRAGIDLEERFWNKVQKGADNDCWPFLGSKHRQGYGRMSWNDKLELTHRIAWSLANKKPLPDGAVLHTCDNPPCCNPRHLFLGDHFINMKDMVSKGRSSHKIGELNGRAIITEEMVREIRDRYNKESASQRVLGEEYNLHQGTVSDIILRKTWSHVT